MGSKCTKKVLSNFGISLIAQWTYRSFATVSLEPQRSHRPGFDSRPIAFVDNPRDADNARLNIFNFYVLNKLVHVYTLQ